MKWVPLVLVMALAVDPGSVVAQDAAETVVFGFQPTDGAQWRKSMIDRTRKEFDGMAPDASQETQQDLLLTYRAGTDGSWSVTQVCQSAQMESDGVVLDNPVLKVAIGTPITLTVNPLGQAVAAAGFDHFWDKLENTLGPEMYSRLVESTSPEQMALNEITIWNKFYAELLGHRISPGEKWRVLDGADIGNGGRSQLFGTISFDGWTELDGVKGFKVTHEFDTTGVKMAAIEEDHTRSISRVGDEQFERNNVDIQGKWVVVIEPASGQLLYSVRDEVTRIPMGAPGDSRNAVFTKHHTYRWTRVQS